METLDKCPVCSFPGFKEFFSVNDHSVSLEKFILVQCDRCTFVFTNPRPEKNSNGRYYESEKYISHSNTSRGLINGLYQGIRKYALSKKIELINKFALGQKTILDIGCGTGEFLNACKQKGWRAKGIEPNEK